MTTITIELDDRSARLIQEAASLANKSVDEWVRDSIFQAAVRTATGAPRTERICGLHPGAIEMAPDFNDPLPEFEPYS